MEGCGKCASSAALRYDIISEDDILFQASLLYSNSTSQHSFLLSVSQFHYF